MTLQCICHPLQTSIGEKASYGVCFLGTPLPCTYMPQLCPRLKYLLPCSGIVHFAAQLETHLGSVSKHARNPANTHLHRQAHLSCSVLCLCLGKRHQGLQGSHEVRHETLDAEG
eukprot:scaffold258161_cov14-Tisochrysis_lutea.AAC.2